MSTKPFPEIYKILYRGARAAVAAGIAQIILIPNWQSQPGRTLLVAFLTGFLPSVGMYLRDKVDGWFGWDEKSFVQKTMII